MTTAQPSDTTAQARETDALAPPVATLRDNAFLRLEALTAAHIELDRDRHFADALDDLVDVTLTRKNPAKPLTPDNRVEAIAIAVSGKPGAGKSRLVEYGLARHDRFQAMLAETMGRPNPGRALWVETPEDCSLKALASNILRKIGFPKIDPRATRSSLWDEAKIALAANNVRVLILSEFQNILHPDKEAPTETLMKHVRSLLILPENPINLIAIGQRVIDDAFWHDGSIYRRHIAVHLDDISLVVDHHDIEDAVGMYAAGAGLSTTSGFAAEITPRLVHASNKQVGLVADWCLRAVKHALRANRTSLTIEDFQAAYDRKYRHDFDKNPFRHPDWESIDMTVLDDPDTKRARKDDALAAFRDAPSKRVRSKMDAV